MSMWRYNNKLFLLLLYRRLDQGSVNKKKQENLPYSGLFCPGRAQSKIKESKKRDQCLDIAGEQKKNTLEHGIEGDTNCN